MEQKLMCQCDIVEDVYNVGVHGIFGNKLNVRQGKVESSKFEQSKL
jgi:hypothetical protein